MNGHGPASFEQHFHELSDPRVERTRKHPLLNIIFMSVCGVVSGANSIAGIPELLQLLDISGALVTIDAMGCQREIADRIRAGGGDYVLAVKQNQPKLYEQVESAITEALEGEPGEFDEHETVEKGHGRRETRTYAVIEAPQSVDPDELWRDLSAVGMAISERED